MTVRAGLPEAIAGTMLAGFDRHYAVFRYNAQQAKGCFEAGDWHAIRRLARERITFYDQRVQGGGADAAAASSARATCATPIWSTVKRRYVALLADHKQPELAETFFNTVSTKILAPPLLPQRLHLRPARRTPPTTSTRRRRPSVPTTPPTAAGKRRSARSSSTSGSPAATRTSTVTSPASSRPAASTSSLDFAPASDCQINVLRSLFFRNKAAYLIGRAINDGEVEAFAIPILRDSTTGRLFLDTVLFGTERIEALFNFSRAYFMVDMETPSAYVRFLQSLMPTKPQSELYTMLGLHKQGKTLFYRDLLQHLAPFHRQVHRRARHQGPGDGRLHAAVVPVRLQVHQGRPQEGRHPGVRRGPLPAGQGA